MKFKLYCKKSIIMIVININEIKCVKTEKSKPEKRCQNDTIEN